MAINKSVDQLVLPDPNLPPQLSRYERIDTLHRIEGFIPPSRTELNEVMGLESFIDRPGGAAKHLAEVSRQQAKAGVEDPTRAARKITHDYVGYAQNALDSTRALEVLKEELEDANPELILDRVVEAKTPGVLEMLRFFDLHLYKQTNGDIWQVGYDPQAFDYSRENPGIMFYAGEAVQTWRVHQIRKKLPDALGEQAARFAFFAERLVEITDHSPKQVSAVAHKGLDQIYDRTQTIKSDTPQL